MAVSPQNKDPLEKLQKLIGYQFQDLHWLERAMTHSSTAEDYNYERLEFLGDRVLGLVIANALFETFRKEREGGLAKRHAALVQGRTLAVIASMNKLGEYIILSDAERKAGGTENENILADILESLIGAIFVDGGYEPARDFILKFWGDNIETLTEAPLDPKTELQEWVQAKSLPLPVYEVVDKTGPDHAPVFTIELTVQGQTSLRAEGPSRRQAEKTAARQMLARLKD